MQVKDIDLHMLIERIENAESYMWENEFDGSSKFRTEIAEIVGAVIPKLYELDRIRQALRNAGQRIETVK